MNAGRGWLFYLGVLVAIVGLLMTLMSRAALGFSVGVAVTCAGLVLFAMGLRARLKQRNHRLGDGILIGTLLAVTGLAGWAFIFG